MAQDPGAAQPVDALEIDLGSYKGLNAPWTDWRHLAGRGRFWARILGDLLLRPQEDER